MSDIETISTLELLPNEILFECFKYLDSISIIQSFNQLNIRFNNLIENIPLHLDFRNIYPLLFDRICKKIFSNDRIKQQIYSLSFSNTDIDDYIGQFLSYFSFDKFPHLQSLTLIKVKENNLTTLEQILPLLFQLSCFKLFDSIAGQYKLLSALPTSQLRVLELPSLYSGSEIKKFSFLTNLTVNRYFLDKLDNLFKSAPNLKYLKIEQMDSSFYETYSSKYCSTLSTIHLKHLIIMKYESNLGNLTKILKQTPNLTNLTINSFGDISMMNANRWEYLISSSLPYLKIFKFHCQCQSYYSNIERIKENFDGFQNDFWCKQHQWYTECILSKNRARIYTIPYMFSIYRLIPDTIQYYRGSINNVNSFNNVTDLTIGSELTRKECEFHFSNVTSLTLDDAFHSIECLQIIVNLSNLKKLVIRNYCYTDLLSELLKKSENIPGILLELLKHAPKLSSLTLNSYDLFASLKNNEICDYFHKRITKLNINDRSNTSMDDIIDLEQFCKIFSNLEELKCNLDQQNAFLFLLNHLPKLSCISTFSFRFTCDSVNWLKQLRINGKTISDFYHDTNKHLTIRFEKEIC